MCQQQAGKISKINSEIICQRGRGSNVLFFGNVPSWARGPLTMPEPVSALLGLKLRASGYLRSLSYISKRTLAARLSQHHQYLGSPGSPVLHPWFLQWTTPAPELHSPSPSFSGSILVTWPHSLLAPRSSLCFLSLLFHSCSPIVTPWFLSWPHSVWTLPDVFGWTLP